MVVVVLVVVVVVVVVVVGVVVVLLLLVLVKSPLFHSDETRLINRLFTPLNHIMISYS